VPGVGRAQSPSAAPADSATLVEEARERQRAFEAFRQSRIPVERSESGATCDQSIGRICIWFGGEDEERFPPEPPETEQARKGLIGVLLETREQVDDAWVLGQLVHYLVEQGDFRYAERVGLECGIPQAWWCSALLGYGRHVRGEFVGAEAAFRDALASMPPGERRWWTTPRYILTPEAVEAWERLEPDERERTWELFWRLSDPLFLVEGNDRLTDQMARRVEVLNHRDAGHPQGMEWDVDMEETLLRYGRIMGWSRTHNPRMSPPGHFSVNDTRRVIGHHDPASRGYLFPEEFLEAPADIPPESWITAPRVSRTWYAPPYAPDFRGLETQVGRFRRGDEMLVVGAYRPAAGVSAAGVAGVPGAVNPFERVEGPVDAALFLMPENGGEPFVVSGDEPQGVFTLRAPPGRYVSSLEVFDPPGKRAWRARQGVKQTPLVPGLIGVSDLLILDRDAPFPESLEEAIPHVRPGVRVRQGERFTVVWEVYGLGVAEPVEVTVGFTRGRPGFLSRVGEFLGILEPDRPVEITFTETDPDAVQSAFRAIEFELPEVDPGEYTLHLRLELRGREPVITSRPIVVEEGVRR
jgi:hypothetical protein